MGLVGVAQPAPVPSALPPCPHFAFLLSQNVDTLPLPLNTEPLQHLDDGDAVG